MYGQCFLFVGNFMKETNIVTKPKIVVCLGSSCFSRGNEKIIQMIEQYLIQNELKDEIDVELSGTLCQGRCAEGPNIMFGEIVYSHVESGVMLDLLKKHLPFSKASE